MIKRQVFDIPVPRIEVTEHQVEVKICACCKKRVTASFPPTVKAPTQYGQRIQSCAVYFQQHHFLPEDRLQEVFKDLWGLSIATGTLVGFSQSVYEKLESFEHDIMKDPVHLL